jgi:hypothetical protein
VNSWWFGRDFPAWRTGERPQFIPIDLRSVVNHTSHPTGTEMLEPGRAPPIDLRYLPVGRQTLAGVDFEILGPAGNGDRSILMLGRVPDAAPANVRQAIRQSTPPIPIGRQLSSIAFLRARWVAVLGTDTIYPLDSWLRPTCRVVFDDGSWLVVDCFTHLHHGCNKEDVDLFQSGVGLFYRAGWYGNTPAGRNVSLHVAEWVNPYPERPIASLDFFIPRCPDLKGADRVNPRCEAVVAISGVDVTERDLAFWAQRTDRPPRLPPLQADGNGVEVGAGTLGTVKPLPGSRLAEHFLYMKYPGVYADARFGPFGIEFVFPKAVELDRVELRGPMSFINQPFAGYTVRSKKIDVTVEVSEDGSAWHEAGGVRGISLEADFLPVRLPAHPIRGLRLTATAFPYRQHYPPVEVQGDIFWREYGNWGPHFCWRLFRPEGSGKDGK